MDEQEKQFLNFLASKLQDIEAHVDTTARIARYQEWRRLLEDEKYSRPYMLTKYGYRVYSMNDQDGIIHEIFRRIGVTNKMFIEFGCDNGIENNTHYLLAKGWNGLWLDGNEQHIVDANEKFKLYVDQDKLKIWQGFVTRDNINDTFSGLQDPDLMVIDIDWNDYYVWDALSVIKPRVICIEYNSSIPPPVSVVVPHAESPIWKGDNYFGASLCALNNLAEEKEYCLVGCSIAGTDAFFVREDILNDDTGAGNLRLSMKLNAKPEQHYEPPRFNLEFQLGHQSGAGYWKEV